MSKAKRAWKGKRISGAEYRRLKLLEPRVTHLEKVNAILRQRLAAAKRGGK